MEKTKRNTSIIAIIIAIVLAIFGIKGCQTNDTDINEENDEKVVENASVEEEETISEEEAAAIRKENNLCLVTIENGASEANTQYAVNGLHVYDPTSEDLDDFISGVELPIGTNVSIFVYNLASEVHLTIIHNGETIADKDYAILESDEDVEFFEFQLEGDLEVRTTVAEEVQTEGSAKVTITNNKLASVSIKPDTKTDELEVGKAYDFTISAKDKNINVSMKMNGRMMDEASIKAGSSHTFKDITVKGDITFDVAEEIVLDPSNKHTISIDKRTGGDVTLNIRWVDDNLNIHDISSGQSYPDGLEVYCQVINASNRPVRISAYLGGSSVGSKTLPKKPANDDASYGGLDSIILRSNLRYVLEYAGEAAPEEEKKPEEQTKPVSKETATITINHKAAEANTKYAVNGLHVYDPDSKDMDDFVSGTKVPLGSKVKIYIYNLASPVHLNIKHNGKTIADKDYGILESDDDVEFFDLVVEGDIIVTSSVVKNVSKTSSLTIKNPKLAEVKIDKETYASGASIKNGKHNITIVNKDKPVTATVKVNGKQIGTKDLKAKESYNLSSVNVDGDVLIELKEIKQTIQKYKVNIINNIEDEDVTLNIRWVDDDMNIHDIQSGNSFEEGLLVYSQIINASDQKVKLIAKSGEEVIDEIILGEKPENDDASYGGLETITLEDDLTFELDYFKGYEIIIDDQIQNKDVTLNVRWLDEEMNIHDIQSGDVFEEGMLIYTQLINASDKKIKLIAQNDDEVIEEIILDEKPENDDASYGGLQPIELKSDLKYTLTYAEAENESVNLHIENATLGKVTINGKEMQDGDSLTKGTSSISIQANEDITVTIKNKTETIQEKELSAGETTDLDLDVQEDLTITFTQKQEEVFYTVTIDHGAAEANTNTAVNGLHVYDPTSKNKDDFTSGTEVKKGSKVTIFVYNLASEVHLTITHNGQTIVDKDYAILESDEDMEFFDLTVEGDITVKTSVIHKEETREEKPAEEKVEEEPDDIPEEIVEEPEQTEPEPAEEQKEETIEETEEEA